RNGKHAPLAAGQKVRRLSHVWTAGIDVVVGTDRNVDFLPRIPIVVAHQERAASILVVVPALERAGDAVTGAAARFGDRDLLGGNKNAASKDAGGAKEPESVHCCFSLSLLVAFAIFALRSAWSCLNSASLKYVTFIQACAISSTVRSP